MLLIHELLTIINLLKEIKKKKTDKKHKEIRPLTEKKAENSSAHLFNIVSMFPFNL